MELFPTRNKVELIDKKIDGLVAKFEEYTLSVTDKFEKLEQSISCVEQQNIENNNKINMVSEQLCSNTENLNIFFDETNANIASVNRKCEIILDMLNVQEDGMKAMMTLLNNKANENKTLIKGLTDSSVKIIENNELVKGTISDLQEEIANNNLALENKISKDATSLISVFSDKYNLCDKQLREIVTSVNSNELSISELKENLAKVYDKTSDGVLISKNIQETISKEFDFNREVACGLKNIEEKVLAIKSLSNDKFNSVIKMLTDTLDNDETMLSEIIKTYDLFDKKSNTDSVIIDELQRLRNELSNLHKFDQAHFNSVEDRQKKISELCSNVLSNIASVEESTRLLLVNNIINKVHPIQ